MSGKNKYSESGMIGEYEAFLSDNELPTMSADELILESYVTEECQLWLSEFITRWELSL